MDAEVLRRLDRMTTLLIPQRTAERAPEATARIVRRARWLELDLRVVGPDLGEVADLQPHERVRTDRKLSKVVRRLQRTGAGVIVVADGPCEGFRAADLGVALESRPPPWGAHVIARHGVHDVLLLLDAVADAKKASEQSVGLALAEAATGLVLAFAGLNRRTSQRVMSLANGASLLAMANGARLAHGLRRPLPRPPADRAPYHAMEPDEVLAHVDGRREGLRAEEAERRRPPAPPEPGAATRFGRAVLGELANPMTPILGLGAGLSASVGSVVDAGLILGAMGLDGLIGGGQRLRAERAIEALEAREDRAVRCLRDGAPEPVRSTALVVGDVIELEAGEVVPADARVLEASGLELDESALTGESLPVAKAPDPVQTEALAERTSMVYAGTAVAAGRLRAVVVATGDDTEAGRARAEASERTQAGGVEARLSSLSSLTMPVAGASALLVLGSGLARGRPYREVIDAAVGLGVASVPEGLPILSTLAQLAAARRLGERGVLVRNPRALEPLGRVDVLCCDKTGTLTEGKIRLAVVSDGKRVVPAGDARRHLREVLAVAAKATPRRNGGDRLPHPTDEALLSGCVAVGIDEHDGLDGDHERYRELPFEPGRSFHATLGEGDGAVELSVKGAPEVVLPRCTRRRTRKRVRRLSKGDAKKLVRMSRSLARQGYRVLAVASREAEADEPLEDEGAIEGLTFRGFVGLADPVRGASGAAIGDLHEAGVRILMLTGDHPHTAAAIAEELGLAHDGVLTGPELEELGDEALAERLDRTRVVARVSPSQKVRLVRALQAHGLTVGMTGDGANDAAAIELADVGIAVGADSTAAARHAADLVVTDDRIETLVEAVLEGRALWKSVRDAVGVLVGGNLGEIGFTALSGLLTGRSPLNARQLLLVNLITDTLPALSIAVRPPERAHAERLLNEGPEASLGARLERDLWVRAAITAGAAGVAHASARLTGCSPAKASTVGLVGLTGAQLGQTLLLGGRNAGVLAAGLGSLAFLLAVVETPGLSHFFGCRPLGPIALGQALFATGAATAVAAAVARREASEGAPPPSAGEVEPAPPEPRAPDAIVDLTDDRPVLFGGLVT
jgi:calcium-translocating P-type ATPase